jgi:hypothetical protein
MVNNFASRYPSLNKGFRVPANMGTGPVRLSTQINFRRQRLALPLYRIVLRQWRKTQARYARQDANGQ